MSRNNKKLIIMKKLNFNLSKDQVISKKQLAEICGGDSEEGGYICTCWNEDGSKTILREDATDPIDCAMKCLKYKEQKDSTYVI